MNKLQWLSVNDLINYKISIFIHSVIHHNSPSYLSDCVDIVQQSRAIRQYQENTISLTVRYLPGSASSIFLRCWICDVELATVIASQSASQSDSPSDISPVQQARSFWDAGSVMWNSLPSSHRAIEETENSKHLKLFF